MTRSWKMPPALARRHLPGRDELAVDLLHKAVYAFATGADALAARSGAGPGQRHAAVLPGRHADVGPLPRDAVYSR
jgi:hypothetical protein